MNWWVYGGIGGGCKKLHGQTKLCSVSVLRRECDRCVMGDRAGASWQMGPVEE